MWFSYIQVSLWDVSSIWRVCDRSIGSPKDSPISYSIIGLLTENRLSSQESFDFAQFTRVIGVYTEVECTLALSCYKRTRVQVSPKNYEIVSILSLFQHWHDPCTITRGKCIAVLYSALCTVQCAWERNVYGLYSTVGSVQSLFYHKA